MTKNTFRATIALAIVLPVSLLIWYVSGYMPGTLGFDSSGIAHGTGTQQYFYGSGDLKLEDRYVAGELVEQTWYKPDGSVLANEHYVDGCGTGYYLREDGSIRVKMSYVNGLAHGPATYYSEDGEIDRVVEFVNGQEQSSD